MTIFDKNMKMLIIEKQWCFYRKEKVFSIGDKLLILFIFLHLLSNIVIIINVLYRNICNIKRYKYV